MFAATEITNFLACRHLTTLERARAEEGLRRPFRPKAELELLRGLGLDHERAYLRYLTDELHQDVVDIPTASWAAAARATARAMGMGAQVIYQATFEEPAGRGRADFLIRVEKPSYLGFWSYEAVEAKLARSTKASALIQLCFYSELLWQIQGVLPESMHVVLGDGRQESFRVSRYVAYFRRVRTAFEQTSQIPAPTYPDPVKHCQMCSWQPHCEKQWRADDYLSLIAGITRNQRKTLTGHNVTTLAGVARLELPAPQIQEIGDSALRRVRDQASLQFRGREQRRYIYELLEPIEPERGLAALPPPSAADLFLDFESSRFAFDQGLEYLTGFVTLESSGPVYQCLWALDPAAEKTAFEGLIGLLMQRLKRDPGMHVYHYASYEPTAIKRLAGRHGVCTDEVDHLLRAGVFVDLYRVVRQGLRASVESYSIKRLEPLYGFVRSVPLMDANLALDIFGTALALGSPAARTQEIMTAIEGYNRDDCISALRLRDWLETLRNDVESSTGMPVPRPAPKPGDPAEKLAEYLAQVRAVEACLLEHLPPAQAEAERPPEWLLAQLLEWHRREDKSAWWEYFRLCELSDDELQEDKDALGGLVYIGAVRPDKKSIIHRYSFPPQDHSMDRAHTAHDPRTQAGAGEIVAIDDANRTIDLKRGAASPAPHPTALIPYEVVPAAALRDSLLRLGFWVAGHGIDSPGPFRCGRDLLLRRTPRLTSDDSVSGEPAPGGLVSIMNAGPDFIAGATRVVLSLADTVLPIQGPPGSGKTHTASRIILELVRQGKRVGITAVSHKVITQLLGKVCEAACAAGIELQAIQKADDKGDACAHPSVTRAKNNESVCAALAGRNAHVAAGTAWLWAREEMADSVDYLFVDEAGQMSLANVLAVSQAARNLVLIGDPQQLDQPQRGVHPPGAGASALAHLLDGKATITADRGLFLPDTWRLHPDLCGFTSEVFYEGRLSSRPENRTQRIKTTGPLDGTGLRFCPVDHVGNQSESREEVERIAQLFAELLSPFSRVPASPQSGSEWTDKDGETRPLTLNDILVVAPYNAQVSALAARLPEGARIGTVDKFQGQEAPVVIYSMATSTWEDAPRGMEFLYSLNRLNVATSRAQCVVALVASPALFNVECKTPRQMELANAFCRFLELAQSI
jgi:predicted RecB family nuclease